MTMPRDTDYGGRPDAGTGDAAAPDTGGPVAPFPGGKQQQLPELGRKDDEGRARGVYPGTTQDMNPEKK